MKLLYSPTSPYVRKVTVASIETGLYEGIELLATNVWDSESDISTHNPLGKVPVLITPDCGVLFDSPVICEYLDNLHEGEKLFPPTGPARWTALRRQALGDGILDAAVSRLLESKRPAGEKSDAWIGRQRLVIERSLDELEGEASALAGPLTVGHIAIGCALGYMDFRFADDNWRAGHPELDAWFETFAARRSMTETLPKDPV